MKRITVLSRAFPVWGKWFNQLAIPETSRQGIRRGDPIPIGGDKFCAAALMLLFPRGLHTANAIGKALGTSGGVVRNWRAEDRFQALVGALEIKFTLFVLKHFHELHFFETFCISTEHVMWNDRVLDYLFVHVGRSLLDTMSEEELEAFDHIRRKLEAVQVHYNATNPIEAQMEAIFEGKTTPRIPIIGFITPFRTGLFELWRILDAALDQANAYPSGKRGRPKKMTKLDHTEIIRERRVALVEMYLRKIDWGLREMFEKCPDDVKIQEYYEHSNRAHFLISRVCNSYRVDEGNQVQEMQSLATEG